tara:strand:+ start:335 stop:694 length:360 start_codon:yes stop_codon:yes gene_type:complete
MPLLIGVKNGIEKGFTEDELDIINSFPFGVIMMSTETGVIKDVNEFRLIVLERNFISKIYPTSFFKEFLSEDMVTRMKNADWSCNVGTTTRAKFNKEVKRILYSQHKEHFNNYLMDEEE